MSSSMNSLKVPESGLQLEGSTGKDASLPSQAFAVTLSDNVIEDMIKCVQNGDGIQLALGANPVSSQNLLSQRFQAWRFGSCFRMLMCPCQTLLFGSKSHAIEPPSDSNPYDLYLTRPFESTRTAEKIPYTGSLFEKPSGATSKKLKTGKADSTTDGKTAKSSRSAQSGRDSDIEALQNGLAAHAASQEKSVSLASSFGMIILTCFEGLAWLTGYQRRRQLSRAKANCSTQLHDRSPSHPVKFHSGRLHPTLRHHSPLIEPRETELCWCMSLLCRTAHLITWPRSGKARWKTWSRRFEKLLMISTITTNGH